MIGSWTPTPFSLSGGTGDLPELAVVAASSAGPCPVYLSCVTFIFEGLCSGSCFPGLNPSLVFKRWIFLLCLCYLWLNIEEIPRFQYQMLLGNFPGLKSPAGKPGGAKPLQGKWKSVDPSTCDPFAPYVCGPPACLGETLPAELPTRGRGWGPGFSRAAQQSLLCAVTLIADGSCLGSCFPGFILFGI